MAPSFFLSPSAPTTHHSMYVCATMLLRTESHLGPSLNPNACVRSQFTHIHSTPHSFLLQAITTRHGFCVFFTWTLYLHNVFMYIDKNSIAGEECIYYWKFICELINVRVTLFPVQYFAYGCAGWELIK